MRKENMKREIQDYQDYAGNREYQDDGDDNFEQSPEDPQQPARSNRLAPRGIVQPQNAAWSGNDYSDRVRQPPPQSYHTVNSRNDRRENFNRGNTFRQRGGRGNYHNRPHERNQGGRGGYRRDSEARYENPNRQGFRTGYDEPNRQGFRTGYDNRPNQYEDEERYGYSSRNSYARKPREDENVYVHSDFYTNVDPPDFGANIYKIFADLEYHFLEVRKDAGGSIFCIDKPDKIPFIHDFMDLVVQYNETDGAHLVLSPGGQRQENLTIKLEASVMQHLLMEITENTTEKELAKRFVELKAPFVQHLVNGIYTKGFSGPADVQKLVMIEILKGRDAIIQFKAGQGKTLAYTAPMLWNFDPRDSGLQFITVVPTKELAQQVYDLVKALVPEKTLVELCTGTGGGPRTGNRETIDKHGYKVYTNLPNNRHALIMSAAKAQIIVTTVGTLWDFIVRKKAISTKGLKAICFDEYDILVTPNSNSRFQNPGDVTDPALQIELLLQNHIPPTTQRIFISATVTKETGQKVYSYCRNSRIGDDANPFIVRLKADGQVLHNVAQYFVVCTTFEEKMEILGEIFRGLTLQQTIIFCNTKQDVDAIYDNISSFLESDLGVVRLHSGMLKHEREDVFARFRSTSGGVRFLIATDVAHRGLDIGGVTLVVNFDMPNDPTMLFEIYTHRIGRAGRYGKTGIAISLVTQNRTMNELGKINEINIKYESPNPVIVPLPDLAQLNKNW